MRFLILINQLYIKYIRVISVQNSLIDLVKEKDEMVVILLIDKKKYNKFGKIELIIGMFE